MKIIISYTMALVLTIVFSACEKIKGSERSKSANIAGNIHGPSRLVAYEAPSGIIALAWFQEKAEIDGFRIERKADGENAFYIIGGMKWGKSGGRC